MNVGFKEKNNDGISTYGRLCPLCMERLWVGVRGFVGEPDSTHVAPTTNRKGIDPWNGPEDGASVKTLRGLGEY